MNNFEQNKNIEALLEDVKKLHPDWLIKLVSIIENNELGQLVVKRNPDRRLYAVLNPTPDEYLQRFRAQLELADESASLAWQKMIRFLLSIIKYSDYIGECRESGQISCKVADDLLVRLWENIWIEVTDVLAK